MVQAQYKLIYLLVRHSESFPISRKLRGQDALKLASYMTLIRLDSALERYLYRLCYQPLLNDLYRIPLSLDIGYALESQAIVHLIMYPM
jgi:hypothetical protein